MLYLEDERFELNTRGGVLPLVTSMGVFSDMSNELPLLLPFFPVSTTLRRVGVALLVVILIGS